MRSIFKFIIGIFILILISVHIAVVVLLICPVPKLLNIVLANDIQYMTFSKTPEHIYQIFSDNSTIDLPQSNNPIRQVSSKILLVKHQKFFDENEKHELYLNTLDFGGDVIGIESASHYYFNKPASDLSFEETLTLAGLYRIFKS